MYNLYRKSELWFSLLNIFLYVLLMSLADEISRILGLSKVVTVPVGIIMTVFIVVFLCKNNLTNNYGLCKSPFNAKYFLYFIPLAVIVSINFWFGVSSFVFNTTTVLFFVSMLFVGFLEEVIFRGFLFKALLHLGKKMAIIISSVSFGLGHIINLFTSAGVGIVSNLCQILSAIAIGFLFVIIFDRGKTLWPCIITHSLFNALSVFYPAVQGTTEIIISAVITIISVVYALVLIKIIPVQSEPQIQETKE